MTKKIPKHITLILNETHTIFLLSLPSCTVLRDTDEGHAAEEDNLVYESLTSEKGRSRKVSSIGVQTIPFLHKTRHTEPTKIEIRENSAFASNWEMYDTYKELNLSQFNAATHSDTEDEDSNFQSSKLINSPDESDKNNNKRDLDNLFKNRRFLEAVMVIERLLAGNSYNKQQKRFKGLIDKDLYSLDIQYNYKLDLLWTFYNEYTKNRCVTAISLNSLTEDVIAVGYGKYYFTDTIKTGVVMVWNIKNPKQPEREHFFYHSVTSIDFSKKNPNLLAVGFYNGDIKILDISTNDFEVVREDSSASFEPAWEVTWFQEEREEKLLACFGDGRVCKFKISESAVLERVEIMRTCKIEGRLKGIDCLRLFEGNHVSSTRYAAAKCLTMHSSDPYTYLLATNEGVMHRCYTNLFNKHVEAFKSHEGTVNSVKFSPFANKLFATCGNDFSVNLWADSIDEPLLHSRYCLKFVQDIDWSPSHSTIFVSIRGKDIFMWDLQRKIFAPESSTRSPQNSLNTVCKFLKSGRCLLVGDIDGNLNVFSLEDMPFPAFFQENLFLQSLKRLLGTNPEKLKQLQKLGRLNYDKEHFAKHFSILK